MNPLMLAAIWRPRLYADCTHIWAMNARIRAGERNSNISKL